MSRPSPFGGGGGKAPFAVASPKDFRPYAVFGIGGAAGAGKTTLTGLAGKDRKVLVFDIEGGSTSFNSKFFKDHPDASEIDVVSMYGTEYNDPTKLTGELTNSLTYLANNKNTEGYDVVVIDSLIEFQERFITHHSADGFTRYRLLSEALHRILQTAQGIPAHVVFTSRLDTRQDEVVGQEVVRFSMPAKSWSVVSGLLDVIAFKTVQTKGFGKNATDVHVLDTRPSSRFQGKDRYGIGIIEDPTMVKLIDIVSGKGDDN